MGAPKIDLWVEEVAAEIGCIVDIRKIACGIEENEDRHVHDHDHHDHRDNYHHHHSQEQGKNRGKVVDEYIG